MRRLLNQWLEHLITVIDERGNRLFDLFSAHTTGPTGFEMIAHMVSRLGFEFTIYIKEQLILRRVTVISRNYGFENAIHSFFQAIRFRFQMIRSHPPPHAGCPRGDPGPLAVLTHHPLFSFISFLMPRRKNSAADLVLIPRISPISR